MPIKDLAAQCASLANDYGTSHGANSPDEFEVALYLGDPTGSGVEVADETTIIDEDTGIPSDVANGYAPAVVDNDGTTFPAPDPDTGVLTSMVVEFPESLEAYPGTVTHWLLRDSTTGDGWDTGALPADDQLTVAAAGVTPQIILAIFFNPNAGGLV